MNLTSMHARSRWQGVELSAQNRAELIAERKRRGWHKSELAKMLGCTTQHVGAMERGVHGPRWDLFYKWVTVSHRMTPKTAAANRKQGC